MLHFDISNLPVLYYSAVVSRGVGCAVGEAPLLTDVLSKDYRGDSWDYTCTALHSTVLYCTVLLFTVPHLTVLYFTVMHFTLLYFTVLQFTVLYFTVLYFTVLYFTTLNFAVFYFTVLNILVLCALYSVYCTLHSTQQVHWSVHPNVLTE